MYRSKARVKKFADFGPEEWTAFELYEMDEIKDEEVELSQKRSGNDEINKKQVDFSKELFDALEVGRLSAFGRRSDGGTVFEEIPAVEWCDLVPIESGPYLRSPSGEKIIPWLNIRVRCADVEKLWRAPSETEARTRYDWKEIQKIHDDVRKLHPHFSKNEVIKEIQEHFQNRFNKEPPSRSSIQRHMKDW